MQINSNSVMKLINESNINFKSESSNTAAVESTTITIPSMLANNNNNKNYNINALIGLAARLALQN